MLMLFAGGGSCKGKKETVQREAKKGGRTQKRGKKGWWKGFFIRRATRG